MTKYIEKDIVIENLCRDLLRYMSFSKYVSSWFKRALDKCCTNSIEFIDERHFIFHSNEMAREQACVHE